MDLELLRSFLAVSKYKSLSKAAQSLHITQPTLSTRIKNLEKELNTPLLTRDWQGVHLTNYGLLFMPHTIDMLNRLKDFTSMKENYRDIYNNSLLETIEEMNNTFRIGINNYLTAEVSEKIIEMLVQQFPSVTFEFLTGPTQNLIELIEHDALDVIIFYTSKQMNHPETKFLALDELVFVFNENDYNNILEDPLYLSKINKPLYVNSNPALDSYLLHFKHVIEHLHIHNFKFVSNLNIMRQLILADKGYAAIPKSVYNDHFDIPHIHTYKFSDDLPSLPIYMRCNGSSSFKHIIEEIYELLAGEDFF